MQAIEQNLKDLHVTLHDTKATSLLNPVSIISDINDLCSKLNHDDIGNRVN